MTQRTPKNSGLKISLPQSSDNGITPSPTDSANRRIPSNAGSPLTLMMRILAGTVSLFLIAGFWLASTLEPSPRGYGTHQQLGLPPCSIQLLLRIPCPSCGMTTSFSWFVRGQILESAIANPAGLYLAIICLLLIPWTAAISLWNRCLLTNNPQLWAMILGCLYFLILAVQWVVKFYLEDY